jgi:hypothetical protein
MLKARRRRQRAKKLIEGEAKRPSASRSWRVWRAGRQKEKVKKVRVKKEKVETEQVKKPKPAKDESGKQEDEEEQRRRGQSRFLAPRARESWCSTT